MSLSLLAGRTVDSIYRMTLRLLEISFLTLNVIIASLCTQRCDIYITLCFPLICKPQVVYRFNCMALFDSQKRRHMINYTLLEPHLIYLKATIFLRLLLSKQIQYKVSISSILQVISL